MSRVIVLAALVAFSGCVLLLAEVPWFARRSLVARLRPYTPGTRTSATTDGFLSIESFREAVAPMAQLLGRKLARLAGVHEDLARRLERIESPVDASTYRVRQLTWAGVAFAAAVPIAVVLRLPPVLVLLAIIGLPLLAFLLLEQRVSAASADRQRRLLAELPVVSEQLGMLLGAGYSLGSAMHRLAARGSGVCSRDLARVGTRVRHGLSETEALDEWAALADVDALHRLVAVLALNREAGDLSGLITEEARHIRRDAHRRLIETIERRTQQVWIPVTVAALVPGVIFLAIPFIHAMAMFSGQ
jgi:Flp pilus assembly protein TadB